MRCAGSRTYPKLPKNWSAESEANGLSCEAAREISQPASTKTVHQSSISLHFKPLFLVFISVLLKLSKESFRQGGLRCCSLENICLQWWLCQLTCIEEKLEQNSVRKPLLLTLMMTPLAVQ